MNDQDMIKMEVLFKRYVGTLSEDFQSKLDLVVEGHAALDRKIDQKFDQLTERVDHNSFLIQTLNNKIDGFEDKLTKKIDGFESKLSQKLMVLPLI